MYATFYTSPIGTIEIKASELYITSLLFTEQSVDGDNSSLTPVLQYCVQQLDEYFEGTRQLFNFPLLQHGTPFQSKVWEMLGTIPYGKTVSYLTLSKQYGDVKAIRAVAAANGKNNIAIAIPCHRVIGSNAQLTGYAGGLWRKQWLLEHEAKHSPGVHNLSLF